jgi:hypothetical protein
MLERRPGVALRGAAVLFGWAVQIGPPSRTWCAALGNATFRPENRSMAGPVASRSFVEPTCARSHRSVASGLERRHAKQLCRYELAIVWSFHLKPGQENQLPSCSAVALR